MAVKFPDLNAKKIRDYLEQLAKRLEQHPRN